MLPVTRLPIWMSMFISFISLVLYSAYPVEACQFPDELQGTWYSSHKGNLNFSDNAIYGYPIQMSATVSELNFNCTERDGDYYLLRADRYVFTLNSNIRAYICIQLLRVSQYKYYYYIGSQLSNINDYVYGVLEGTTVTLSDACDRPKPYEAGTFITLVKEDGVNATDLIASTCPTGFLANYNSVSITDSTGSTTCSGSTVNGCNNKTALIYSYESCATGLVFNTGGSVSCLHHIDSGSLSFLHTWNQDVTVDGSSTYRIVCYALKLQGNNIYATIYPRFCSDTTQNETSVPSPGIKLQYTQQASTCVTSITDYNYAGYIVLIVFLALLVIAAVIAGVIIYMYLKGGENTLKDILFCRQTHQITSKDDLELSGRDFPRIKTAKLRKVI